MIYLRTACGAVLLCAAGMQHVILQQCNPCHGESPALEPCLSLCCVVTPCLRRQKSLSDLCGSRDGSVSCWYIWLVYHFGLTQKLLDGMPLKFCTDIHGPKKMNGTDFRGPLTFQGFICG